MNEEHKSEEKRKHEEHGAAAGGAGMGHGSAEDFLRRFWVVTVLLIPLIFTNEAISGYLGTGTVPYGRWIGFGIATAIFGFAVVFFRHAAHEVKSRRYGMMTLVSTAVGAGYLFSVASTFIPALEAEFYLEIGTLIWVLLFGHYLEARSSGAAGNALEEAAKLLPKKAHKIVGEDTKDVDIMELKEGDSVRVLPGERIPADGVVFRGAANVDESLVSGESKPVGKKKGDEAVAGSICLDGSLAIRLSRVGKHSTIGQIQKLIGEAQSTKPRSQRIADKAAAVLTFVAGITALFTILVWTLVVGEPFVFAITLAITVLVIACPHALGLAIPTVTTITTALAVKNGIFIKDLAKIEVIKKANYAVFDKTGTLTKGEFGVESVVPASDIPEDELIALAASLEAHSSHSIGRAIVRYAEKRNVKRKEATEVKNIAGKGIVAAIGGGRSAAGSSALMRDLGASAGETEKEADRRALRGETVVYVADGKKLIGLISLADSIRNESYDAVKSLHALGVKVAMLTGDNKKVAEAVAEELGIDAYFAEVLPEDKYAYVKELQDKGNIVIMVGDGVNDAPAIAQADAGIAIGAGTDVAVEAGDVVLTRSNPLDVVRLLRLSRAVYAKMIQNLVWALGYNVVAIPAAAGAFAVWGFFLRPEIGALIMSLSTVIVVANALTLKRIDLETL